jgi:hypothetical protein
MGECREGPPPVSHRRDRRHDNNASFEGLLRVVREHLPDADLAPIELAHDEAAHWHAGQSRRSGDPYLTHRVAVADIGIRRPWSAPPCCTTSSRTHPARPRTIVRLKPRRAFRRVGERPSLP